MFGCVQIYEKLKPLYFQLCTNINEFQYIFRYVKIYEIKTTIFSVVNRYVKLKPLFFSVVNRYMKLKPLYFQLCTNINEIQYIFRYVQIYKIKTTIFSVVNRYMKLKPLYFQLCTDM